MANLTLIFDPKDGFHLERRPIPEPGANEVLVEIHSVGICGTDLHYWHAKRIGEWVVDKPHILGHETGATVVKVGENVINFKPGDRVCLEPALICWKCTACRSGRYNLCPDAKVQSTPPYDGHFRKYFVHPADLCHKLPDNISLQEGALIEPLSCAIHACNRAKVSMGKTIFIAGAGSIGLLCLLTSKAVGASTICVSDVRMSRLEAAKKLGADHVLLVDTKDSQIVANKVIELMGGQPDITLDCSGTESAAQAGILATRPGGLVEIVGLPPVMVKLPILQHVLKELDLIGCVRFVHCFSTAIDLVSSGKINVKPLITHRFTLEEADKAFETAYAGLDGSVKVMIVPANTK